MRLSSVLLTTLALATVADAALGGGMGLSWEGQTPRWMVLALTLLVAAGGIIVSQFAPATQWSRWGHIWSIALASLGWAWMLFALATGVLAVDLAVAWTGTALWLVVAALFTVLARVCRVVDGHLAALGLALFGLGFSPPARALVSAGPPVSLVVILVQLIGAAAALRYGAKFMAKATGGMN